MLCSLLLISCATIFGQSSPELVDMRSSPDQAAVTVTDEAGAKVFEGKTPTTVTLAKKRAFFGGKTYTVKIQKDGFAAQTVTVDTRLNGWYLAGNIVFGGLIGWLIVDPATGAMWTLDKNKVDLTLEALIQGAITDQNGVNIVLLKNVPLSLVSKMEPVK